MMRFAFFALLFFWLVSWLRRMFSTTAASRSSQNQAFDAGNLSRPSKAVGTYIPFEELDESKGETP